MLDKVRWQIAPYVGYTNTVLYNMGRNSDTIKGIRNRLVRDCLSLHPNGVLLYWDSDVSDYPDSSNKTAEYIADMSHVLDQLQSHVQDIVVTGPTLYGELPHGQNGKDDEYDKYRDINRNMSEARGIAYIDSRTMFFDALPRGWSQHSGYLTLDGEHLNGHGSRILASAIADQFNAIYCRRYQHTFWSVYSISAALGLAGKDCSNVENIG